MRGLPDHVRSRQHESESPHNGSTWILSELRGSYEQFLSAMHSFAETGGACFCLLQLRGASPPVLSERLHSGKAVGGGAIFIYMFGAFLKFVIIFGHKSHLILLCLTNFNCSFNVVGHHCDDHIISHWHCGHPSSRWPASLTTHHVANAYADHGQEMSRPPRLRPAAAGQDLAAPAQRGDNGVEESADGLAHSTKRARVQPRRREWCDHLPRRILNCPSSLNNT